MKIKNTDARCLTIDELRSLVNYANNQRETYNTVGCADAQAILDMYHSMDGWDGFEAFFENDPEKADLVFEEILIRAESRFENNPRNNPLTDF